MGGSASTQVSAAMSVKEKVSRTIDKDGMVNLLMPVYYTSSPLLPHEKEHAIKAFKLISSGLAPEFHRRKKNDPVNTPCTSPPEFFGKQLVKRFVAVHPVSLHMFSNTTTKQGTLFFRMISFIISALEDESKFESHFVMLAKGHNTLGVRAVEYGLFGEALFYVLRLTLGEDYSSMAHIGWVKIFSRILRIVIPVVVDYELDNKPLVAKQAIKRVSKMPLMNNGPLTVTLDADEKENETMRSTSTSLVTYNKGNGGSQ